VARGASTGVGAARAGALALAVLASSPLSAAPRPAGGARAALQDEVTLGTDLVTLDVSVVDRANHAVFDLPRDRFAVSEDGVRQKIDFFSTEQAPISLALVIDSSGSMRAKIRKVAEAAGRLVRAKQPGDEIAVVAFSESADLLEEFTTSEADVGDALAGLDAGGTTALLDAVWVAGDYVQAEGRHRRKALVVVTDGVEKGSFYTSDQAVRHLRELDVRLYVIGFTDDLDEAHRMFQKSERAKAEALVARLAGETGGRAFLPTSLDQLSRISGEIAEDLHTIYAIGYYPSNTKRDGAFRRVSVDVLAAGGKRDERLTARTRAGYFAGAR
jgi:Ca-activated chloride channel family protein